MASTQSNTLEKITTTVPSGHSLWIATELAERCIEAALSGLSACSRRAYAAHIKRWRAWNESTLAGTPAPLTRENVKGYLRALELSGASPQVRNQALAALKRLASEAAELGWIEHNDAAQIARIKSRRAAGVRTGLWLTAAQSQRLMQAPDGTTIAGKRDRAVLVLLLGCGLRRNEACALTTAQCVQHEAGGRMILQNIVGKGGRVRSVQVPRWAAQCISEWKAEVEKQK